MTLIASSDIETIETSAAATIDVAAARLDALCAKHAPVSAVRRESLAVAISLGADATTLATLADAVRVSRKETVLIPQGRFARLSRGKGWCRSGKGAGASWAELEGNEYRVGPGKYVVGSNDGFTRKEQTDWTVSHVQVGTQTWTVAS